MPDYLSCGSCPLDFELSNITQFIEHKSRFCVSSSEATKFALNLLECVKCLRKFNTPWPLLLHIQLDHRLNIVRNLALPHSGLHTTTSSAAASLHHHAPPPPALHHNNHQPASIPPHKAMLESPEQRSIETQTRTTSLQRSKCSALCCQKEEPIADTCCPCQPTPPLIIDTCCRLPTTPGLPTNAGGCCGSNTTQNGGNICNPNTSDSNTTNRAASCCPCPGSKAKQTANQDCQTDFEYFDFDMDLLLDDESSVLTSTVDTMMTSGPNNSPLLSSGQQHPPTAAPPAGQMAYYNAPGSQLIEPNVLHSMENINRGLVDSSVHAATVVGSSCHQPINNTPYTGQVTYLNAFTEPAVSGHPIWPPQNANSTAHNTLPLLTASSTTGSSGFIYQQSSDVTSHQQHLGPIVTAANSSNQQLDNFVSTIISTPSQSQPERDNQTAAGPFDTITNLMTSLAIPTDVDSGPSTTNYIQTATAVTSTAPIVASRSSSSSSSRRREFRFACPQCSKPFRQKVHLRKHVMAQHTKLKPHKCPHCGYTTVEKSHLTVHIRTHTGEKPFRCRNCNYSSAQNCTLKSHYLRRHPGSNLVCGFCGVPYVTEQERNNHQRVCRDVLTSTEDQRPL